MTVFDLQAKLGLDKDDFDKGVREAEGSGKDLKDSLSSSFDKIKTVATAVLSAAIFKGIIDGARNLASEVAAAGDQIDKQSQVLGISRKAYQEWGYILSQNGASIETMSTAMRTLNKEYMNAKDGNKDAASAFAQLGVSVHELDQMNPEEQFEAIVKAFQKLPAGAQKSALAVKIFGRGGMQLLPLLNNSAESIDELRKKAEELGFIMSDEAVDASVEYTDALDTMQRTFNGIKYSIGAKLLPVFTKAMEKITGWAGGLKKAYDEGGFLGVWNKLKEKVTNLQYSDSPFLSGLASAILGIMNTGETVVGLITDFPGTISRMKESDSPFIQGLATALEGVKTAADTAWGLITDFPNTIAQMKESDSPFIQGLATAIEGIKSVAETAWGLITDFPGTIEELKMSDNTVLNIVAELLTAIKDGFDAVIKVINGDWQGAMETLRTSDSEILNTVGVVIDTFADAKHRIDEAIDSAKEFFGISGSGGKLYETYAGKMANSYKEIKDEAGKKAWISELSEGLLSAGFNKDLTKAYTDYLGGLDYTDTGIQNFIGQMMRDLSDPKYADKDSIMYTWLQAAKINEANKDAMAELNASLEISDEEKEKIRKDAEDYLKEHKIELEFEMKMKMANGEWNPGMAAPQGYLWGLGHAKGAWDIPFDNYPALLHRGETVLTASQARRYKEGSSDIDMNALVVGVVGAVREGMDGAQVNSYMDSTRVTNKTNSVTGNRLMARRFAPA